MFENPRLKNLLISVCLLLGGVLFLTMGVQNYRSAGSDPAVKAVVTRIETAPSAEPDEPDSETVYVRYTVDGVVYEEILQYAPGGLSEGQTVTGHYAPLHPEQISGATKNGALIAGGFGAVLCFGGALPLLRKLRKPEKTE